MKSAVFASILFALAAAAPSQGRHHQHHQHKRAASSASASATATLSLAILDSIGTAPSVPSSEASASAVAQVVGDLNYFVDPTVKFEDGVIACDLVPTGQGVVAVDWVSGLTGGWTSIMNSDAGTSESCVDGYYCSYACQAGMSKTQWPSTQPASGATVGGLYCKNGFLYRSNTDTDYLCAWDQPTAFFKSSLDQDVAICRTDYPGSENMNVPTLLEANSTAPASVVESETYFKWQGGSTSAQYYVNNAGVSIQDGCIWGDATSKVGNWAPVVIGSGMTGGVTYLSLIPNPNNGDAPNYNIEIKGVGSAATVGSCSYVNGEYEGGNGSDGCTFSVTSGVAEFIFS